VRIARLKKDGAIFIRSNYVESNAAILTRDNCATRFPFFFAYLSPRHVRALIVISFSAGERRAGGGRGGAAINIRARIDTLLMKYKFT